MSLKEISIPVDKILHKGASQRLVNRLASLDVNNGRLGVSCLQMRFVLSFAHTCHLQSIACTKI